MLLAMTDSLAPVRRVKAWMYPLPHFVILGAMRSGTTSLFNYITAHPCVIAPKEKEIHFFDINFDQDLAWYRSHFPSRPYLLYKSLRRRCLRGIKTGEASPYYLFHPLAPERLASILPAARLIALLRDPVQRAYSHYCHEVAKGRESLGFEEAISQEERRLKNEEAKIRIQTGYISEAHQRYSYLARGRYAEQLRAWLAYFPRQQMLILQSEALFTNALKAYQTVVRFLGLPAWAPDSFPRLNAGQEGRLEPRLQARLKQYFEPYNQDLYDLIGQNYAW